MRQEVAGVLIVSKDAAFVRQVAHSCPDSIWVFSAATSFEAEALMRGVHLDAVVVGGEVEPSTGAHLVELARTRSPEATRLIVDDELAIDEERDETKPLLAERVSSALLVHALEQIARQLS